MPAMSKENSGQPNTAKPMAAATPREVVARLNAALNRATAEAKTREQLESRGATVIQGTPEAFRSFVTAEVAKWAPIVKRAGVVAE